MKRCAAVLTWLLLLLGATAPAWAGGKLPYTYSRLGNSGDGIPTANLQAGTVLMGGGTDVDAAFQWLGARSGNGDFLVIRATGTDAYNRYIRKLCPSLNSVATLIIPTVSAANDSRVADIINKAEAIWIAGGDQSNYINFWKGTPVQKAIQDRIAAGVPIGGTSAGMNVLTQFVYSALATQGVTSSQALADPFNPYMSFDRDFLNVGYLTYLNGVIADPHFVTRDRMGRDLAFLARVWNDFGITQPRGISIDEQTALLIDNAGAATVAGTGQVYFLKAPGSPEVCLSKVPLTYRNIAVYRIGLGDTFKLPTWTGTGGDSYAVSAEAGVLRSTQSGGGIY